MRATLKKLPSDISAMALGDAHGILSSLQQIEKIYFCYIVASFVVFA